MKQLPAVSCLPMLPALRLAALRLAALRLTALMLPALTLPALILPAHAAAAQWIKVASASGSDSYLDKASIRRSAEGYRAATLVSFSATQTTPDGTSYRSMKAQHSYACEQRTTTLLSQTYYPEPMGKGPVGQTFKYEKFAPEDIAPGSAADSALRIVCARGP